MASDKFNLMIVDDVEENRLLLEAMLEDDYALSSVASGVECLEQVKNIHPDLILLDVTMPEVDGYEVCRQIKSNKQTADIPIVFVSALISAEERLAGFEAGGDEYVTKPVEVDELFDKVQRSLETRVESLKLKESASDAMKTAMEAMVSSSELGMLNQFMRECAMAESFEQLADEVLGVSQQLGLNVCFQVSTNDSALNFGCKDESLEAQLLEKFRAGAKVVEFGARTLINSEHAGILVKNMPVEDDTKYGRLKDHLSVLIDTIESKVINLIIEMDLDAQRIRVVQQLLENNDEQLTEIRYRIGERDKSIREVMSKLLQRVEATLFSLGLDEDQEKSLMSLLDNSVEELDNMPDFMTEIEESFAEARVALEKLVND